MSVIKDLKPVDIFGFRSPVAFFHLKAYALAINERFKSGHVDTGMMNKQVLTVFLLNKAKSLSLIKPFYSSFSQSDDLLSWIHYHGPKPVVAALAKGVILSKKNRPADTAGP